MKYLIIITLFMITANANAQDSTDQLKATVQELQTKLNGTNSQLQSCLIRQDKNIEIMNQCNSRAFTLMQQLKQRDDFIEKNRDRLK